MRLSLPILFLFVFTGCAGIEPVASEEAPLVTYTVTFEANEVDTRTIRIMQCDIVTGMCDVTEPEGCRLFDEMGVTAHICDFTVADGDELAFNIQLDDSYACSTDDEECARLGSVHVFRDDAPVDHVRDVHGEFCNFLITSRAVTAVPAVDLDGI